MGNAALAGALKQRPRDVGGAHDAEESQADALGAAVMAALAQDGEGLSTQGPPPGGSAGGPPPDVVAAFRAVGGVDLTGVTIQSGSAAQAAAHALGAEAFAADGVVTAPKGDADLGTLVHELAHVALGHTGSGAPIRREASAGAALGISGTLRYGNRGAAVEKLQSALVRLGYMTQAQMNTGPGIFGRRTRAGVTAFQAAQRITVDGIVGPQTLGRIATALGAVTPDGGGGATEGTRDAAALTGKPALKEGMEGVIVKTLQRRLNHYGASLSLDGEFGPVTARAVRAFQSANGLTVDGIVGPNTAGALTSTTAKKVSATGGGGTSSTAPAPSGGTGSYDVDDADPKGILNDSNIAPKVKDLAARTIRTLQEAGHSPYLVGGFRSFSYQNSLYDKGRTQPGSVVTYVRGGGSWHNYGLAIDFAFWNAAHTGPSWDGRMPWQTLGRAGKAAGWTRWMGDSGWDFGHFEHHPNWGNSCYNLADTFHRDGLQGVWDKVM
jgi:peptidoglycan hydrolase-like protein with peptidoglycan-binding domain